MQPGLTGFRHKMVILTTMVLLGAMLLFMMEPMVGRFLVPYFGGAVHVWLTCMMFFQAILLVGYSYAHLLAHKLGRWHLMLLALPLVNLPLGLMTQPSLETPILALLTVLIIHIALPFAVLSTTAIVAQSWLARSTLKQHLNPYPLYAASNVGSLIGLLGYPFLIEPLLGLRAQSLVWAVGYFIYSGLCVAAWHILRPPNETPAKVTEVVPDVPLENTPTANNYMLWMLLSMLPSALLLAVTNYIALEIGSFPMVWVIPLALYLGSFIITFRSNGGVPKFLNIIWPNALLLGLMLYQIPGMHWLKIIASLTALMIVSLVAHGHLYEQRPIVRYLTSFYLMLAVGGCLGGAFVSLAAPRLFSGLFEYPIILVAFGMMLFWCRRQSMITFWNQFRPWLKGYVGVTLGLMISLAGMALYSYVLKADYVFRHRSFYSIYRVTDSPPNQQAPKGIRLLMNGQTYHGGEYLDNERRGQPTTYYFVGGPISQVYDQVPSPRRVAVIGLGTGSASAYMQSQDELNFYEIDPDNEAIARSWFTFLAGCKGRVDVVTGDGRLSLHKAACVGMKYDLIQIDAFTGDGIPTHLLTREAMSTYLEGLVDQGLMFFHISNRYYDLRPVIKSTARELNLYGVMNIPTATANNKEKYEVTSVCVVLARSPKPLQGLLSTGWVALGDSDGLKKVAPWTDDYINILVSLGP